MSTNLFNILIIQLLFILSLDALQNIFQFSPTTKFIRFSLLCLFMVISHLKHLTWYSSCCYNICHLLYSSLSSRFYGTDFYFDPASYLILVLCSGAFNFGYIPKTYKIKNYKLSSAGYFLITCLVFLVLDQTVQLMKNFIGRLDSIIYVVQIVMFSVIYKKLASD